MNNILEKVLIGIVGGAVGVYICKKLLTGQVEKDKKDLEEKLEEADKVIKDVNRQIDRTVTSVYAKEAKEIFRSRLDAFDLKTVAIRECKDSMKTITETELNRIIRERYSSEITSSIRSEIERKCQGEIQHAVSMYVNEDYIKQISRKYINEETKDILERQIEKAIDSCDINDIVSDYLDDNSIRFDSILRKAITKAVKEKVEDISIEVDDDDSLIRISFD